MKRARTSVLGLLLLSAISFAGSASARPPTAPSGGCPAWSGETTDVAVRWGQATTRTPGCWFFSGPADLGRDDHLGAAARWTREGDRISLAFGGARFEGRLEGRRVRLTRSSSHDSGGRWQVTETITGELREEDGCTIFAGRYHYDECGGGGPCPGQCHIDAGLRLARR